MGLAPFRTGNTNWIPPAGCVLSLLEGNENSVESSSSVKRKDMSLVLFVVLLDGMMLFSASFIFLLLTFELMKLFLSEGVCASQKVLVQVCIKSC